MARLEQAYEGLFGSRTSKGQLYAGFYLLLGGVILGLAAVVLLMVAYGRPTAASEYRWREGAFVMALLAAPAVFLGIQVALPTKRAMRIVGGLGVALCLVGTLLFSIHYPFNFNVPDAANQADYTALDASLYTLGLALLLAGTFTSLIGYYVGRVTAPAAGGGGRHGEYEETQYWGEEVPDSVVERDIDYAMKHYGVEWGEGSTSEYKGVKVNIKDDFEGNVTIGGGKGVARTVTLESPQVEEATQALKKVRPKKGGDSVSSKDVDDSTEALKAFRAQQKANPKQFQARATRRVGFWSRMVSWFRG